VKISKSQLAKMIDHTLLKPTATRGDIERLCREGMKYGFKSVVVNPTHVPLVAQLLKGSDVKVCSVASFPFGTTFPEVKAFEAEKAVENGAHEVDMVINLSALKSGDHELVRKDIQGVVNVKRSRGDLVVKVIIETGYLTDEEKVTACRLAEEAGADFVKTSTGLVDGATVEDVRLIRKTVGRDMGVKASGGIRSLKQALAMIEAGANRIGTSSGVAIIEELSK